jgi:hypothetical protein
LTTTSATTDAPRNTLTAVYLGILPRIRVVATSEKQTVAGLRFKTITVSG